QPVLRLRFEQVADKVSERLLPGANQDRAGGNATSLLSRGDLDQLWNMLLKRPFLVDLCDLINLDVQVDVFAEFLDFDPVALERFDCFGISRREQVSVRPAN